MQQQLSRIHEDLARSTERVQRLAATIPEERFSLRSDPKRWSVAECIAHLNLTTLAYLPQFRAAFDAHPRRDPPPRRYRLDAAGALVALLAGPLPSFGRMRLGRAPTAQAFVPQGELRRELVVGDFDRLQRALSDLIVEADGRPLGDMRIVSPFAKGVRYNAYSALVILARHERRHLWQAEHVWE